MDRVVRSPALLPQGTECRPLDGTTYSLRMPGQNSIARITTSPEVFDEHFESHQLFLPDGPLFRSVAAVSAAGDPPATLSSISRLADLLLPGADRSSC